MDITRPAGIIRNITWLTAASLLVKPIWFVFITAVCMRVLATDGYGVMNTAIWFTAIAAMVSDFGTTQYTVREVARFKDQATVLFSNILVARSLLSAAVWLATMGIAIALGYSGPEMAALAAAGVYTLAVRLAEFCRAFYRAFEVLRFESVSQVLEKVAVVALGSVALLWSRSPQGALVGMAGGALVSVGLNLGWIHGKMARFSYSELSVGFTTTTLKSAFPLGLINVFSVGFISLGVVVLEMIGGESVAGEYSAAYRIVEALQLLPMIVVAALLPRLSSLHHGRQLRSFSSVLNRGIAAVAAAAIGAAVILNLYSPIIINTLAPSASFANSAPLLSILAWSYPLISYNFMMTAALIAADQHNFLAVVLGIGALLNVALNIVLVPGYGAIATAYVFIGLQAVIALTCYGGYLNAVRK